MREKAFRYKLIEQHRVRLGFTQRQLADFCKVTPQAVSLWETGETMPRWDTLLDLAQLFDVNPAEFFGPNDHKSGRVATRS